MDTVNFSSPGRFAPGNKWRFQKGHKLGFTKGHTTCVNLKKRKLYMKIFNWLKENIQEPLLVSDKEEDQPVVNVWFTILNHDPNMFDPDSRYAIQYSNNFIRTVAGYIPEFKKETDFYYNKWLDKELQPQFCIWFNSKKAMLENYMAKEYFMKGKMKDNEILKRRFKRTWSEQKTLEAKVEADQNIKSDNKIELVIKDA